MNGAGVCGCASVCLVWSEPVVPQGHGKWETIKVFLHCRAVHWEPRISASAVTTGPPPSHMRWAVDGYSSKPINRHAVAALLRSHADLRLRTDWRHPINYRALITSVTDHGSSPGQPASRQESTCLPPQMGAAVPWWSPRRRHSTILLRHCPVPGRFPQHHQFRRSVMDLAQIPFNHLCSKLPYQTLQGLGSDRYPTSSVQTATSPPQK